MLKASPHNSRGFEEPAEYGDTYIIALWKSAPTSCWATPSGSIFLLFELSVGSRLARTHGYYKGDAFGVINHMLILSRFFNILTQRGIIIQLISVLGLITYSELDHCADGVLQGIFVNVEFASVVTCRRSKLLVLYANQCK